MANSQIGNLDYKTAMEKGKKMLKMMHDESAVTQSPCSTPGDQEALGYERKTRSRFLFDLSRKLDSFGIHRANSEFINIRDEYTKDLTTGKTLKDARNAVFVSDVNVQAGILIAVHNYSLAYKAKKSGSPVPTLLSSLKHWSDVAFLHWAHSQRPQDDVRNLNFIMRENIVNEDTLAVVNSILDASHRQSQACTPSGLYLAMNSDHAIALLGTAHGAGVAWLLAQHRGQLGLKEIAGISIFYSGEPPDSNRAPNLLFYLRDASASEKPIEKL